MYKTYVNASQCKHMSPFCPPQLHQTQTHHGKCYALEKKKKLPMLRCKCKSCYGHFIFYFTCAHLLKNPSMYWVKMLVVLLATVVQLLFCVEGTPCNLSHLLVCNLWQ